MSAQPDQEVYLYKAEQDRLVCASCDPTGARPVGAEFGESGDERLVAGSVKSTEDIWVASNPPPWTAATTSYVGGTKRSVYQPRFLADSGRLFFDSDDALVSQDVNGTQDVYEYEPASVGGCLTSSPTYTSGSGGCIDLISSGASAENRRLWTRARPAVTCFS